VSTDTDTSNTESSQTESSHTDTSNTESSQTESSHTDTSNTESSQTESSQTESSQTESSQTESSQARLDEDGDDPGNLYTNASSEAVQVTYSENLLNVILIFY